jgi:photosystem II stability/assembly factor-like uncharacterized protein
MDRAWRLGLGGACLAMAGVHCAAHGEGASSGRLLADAGSDATTGATDASSLVGAEDLPPTQGWLPIRSVPPMVPQIAVQGVVPSSDPNVALAVRDDSAVFRTTDGGQSWQYLDAASAMADFFFDPTDATVVYGLQVATAPAVGAPSTLVRSNDTGTTWQTVSDGALPAEVSSLASLAIDPNQPTTMYLTDDLFSMFKSTSRGVYWQRCASPTDSDADDSWVSGFVVDPSTAGRLYVSVNLASNFSSWVVSDDGCDTWTTIYTGGYQKPPAQLVAAPGDPATLYLGTSDNSICRSTDIGRTWNCHDGPAPSPPLDHAFNTLYVDAGDPTSLYVVQAGSDLVGHVFRTTDGGATWITGSTGGTWLAAAAGKAYANVDEALSVSSDWGATWTASTGLDIPFASWVEYAPSGGGVIYATAGSSLLRSTDRGQTWSQSANPPAGFVLDTMSARNVFGIDLDLTFGQSVVSSPHANAGGPACPGYPANQCPFSGLSVDPTDTRVRRACASRAPYETHDGAATWSMIPGLNDCTFTAIDPVSPWTAYIAGSTLLGVSSDRGATWSIATGLPAGSTPQQLVFDPLVAATVYASVGTPQGQPPSQYVVSHDSGATWAPTGWPIGGDAQLAIDPHASQVMYAGDASGVMKTTNGGATWFPVNRGLDGEGACALSVSPDDSALVYLAACAGGFYYTTTGGE